MTRSQLRYLNTILTAVAVLLGVLVWTQVSSRPLLATSAEAQTRTVRVQPPTGIPDAGQQREQMVKAIDNMKKSVDKLSKSIDDGKVRVQVTNLDEIQIEVR